MKIIHFTMTWQHYTYHNIPGSLGPANGLSRVTYVHINRDAGQHYQRREEAAQQTTLLHLEWRSWKSTPGMCRNTLNLSHGIWEVLDTVYARNQF